MQSKNKKAPTVAEKRHIERIAAMDCVVCGATRPSEVHEIDQGEWFTSIPLCATCHRHPIYGLHGQKANWKVLKLDELKALGKIVEALVD